MKIWMVDPGFLPSSLLLRQHQGIHAILNGVLAGKPRRGITRFLKFGGFVVWVHYLSVDEMRRRGAAHASFVDQLWAKLPERQRRFDYPIATSAIGTDIATLRMKLLDSSKRGRMDDCRLSIASCGLQLVELQRKLVAAGRLPKDALLL